MKIIEKITDALGSSLGLSIIILFMAIVEFLSQNPTVSKYGFWINLCLIIIMAIIIFFMFRHQWKCKKNQKNEKKDI